MPLDRSPIMKLRRRRFRSAKAASKALGCSTIHLHQIERGSGAPSVGLEERMATHYHVRRERVARAWRQTRRFYLRAELKKLL